MRFIDEEGGWVDELLACLLTRLHREARSAGATARLRTPVRTGVSWLQFKERLQQSAEADARSSRIVQHVLRLAEYEFFLEWMHEEHSCSTLAVATNTSGEHEEKEQDAAVAPRVRHK